MYSVVYIDESNDWRKCWGTYEDYRSAEKVATILVEQQVYPNDWIKCLRPGGYWVNNVTGGGIYIMEMNV